MNWEDDDDTEEEEKDNDDDVADDNIVVVVVVVVVVVDDDGWEVHEFGQLRWMLYKGNGSLGASTTTIVRGHTI